MIVEDEYMIASDLAHELRNVGAMIAGPVATINDARKLLACAEGVDGAILDINLRGEKVFALAGELDELGIPFLFATGYGVESVPDRFRHILRCEKPVPASEVVSALAGALARRSYGNHSRMMSADGMHSSNRIP